MGIHHRFVDNKWVAVLYIQKLVDDKELAGMYIQTGRSGAKDWELAQIPACRPPIGIYHRFVDNKWLAVLYIQILVDDKGLAGVYIQDERMGATD
jgi:hypothetical protein